MKLIIIRHGDPNYAIDSLTDVGFREAELLASRICRLDVKQFYVSPLGRAQATAKPTLEKMKRTAITKNWLREFPPVLEKKNGMISKSCAWDWLPDIWTEQAICFDKDAWLDFDCFREIGVDEAYKEVCEGLDEVLAEHGYVRERHYYRAEASNEDTLVFFCHFGLECVLLSHLLNISPMQLWHGFCAAPSSVTTLVTEERRKGIASFRVLEFGDTSHLYAGGAEPSFSARFCEVFENQDQRHD